MVFTDTLKYWQKNLVVNFDGDGGGRSDLTKGSALHKFLSLIDVFASRLVTHNNQRKSTQFF